MIAILVNNDIVINMRELTRIYMIIIKFIRLSEKLTGQLKAYNQNKTQQLKYYTGAHREQDIFRGCLNQVPHLPCPSLFR